MPKLITEVRQPRNSLGFLQGACKISLVACTRESLITLSARGGVYWKRLGRCCSAGRSAWAKKSIRRRLARAHSAELIPIAGGCWWARVCEGATNWHVLATPSRCRVRSLALSRAGCISCQANNAPLMSSTDVTLKDFPPQSLRNLFAIIITWSHFLNGLNFYFKDIISSMM